MKTTIRFSDLHVHNSWHDMIEQHVDRWQRLTTVTATEVVMERPRNGRPGILVRVRLQIPAGTLHSETSARTLRAALNEVNRNLVGQVQSRQIQRLKERSAGHQLTAHPASGPKSTGAFF